MAGGTTARTGWTCRRVTNGTICRHHNPSKRTRICAACGKTRPARKAPAHMAALDLPYEEYVRINGGEHCGICGRGPTADRRLDRDHEHKGDGVARGLLCHICNRRLRGFVTLEWLAAATEYLKRAERRIEP